MKTTMYTWDDLYQRAMDCSYGSNELSAKDEARHQIGQLIFLETGLDIESCECAEDEIDRFLQERAQPITFDENGNIISFKS